MKTFAALLSPLVPAVASLALALTLCAPAQAAEDASHFLLTPALMQKFKAAEPDLKRLQRNKTDEANKDSDDDDGKDGSIEDIMKAIDRDPATRAALAKHGLSSRDYAYAAHAMLHAGMYVAMEKLMDKKKGEALYASYTKEQKANNAFMRALSAQQR